MNQTTPGTEAGDLLDSFIHYFDEWEQIMPMDAREALRPLIALARQAASDTTASVSVRNAALEEAALLCESMDQRYTAWDAGTPIRALKGRAALPVQAGEAVDERVLFEARVREFDLPSDALIRWPDGRYIYEPIESNWSGWQWGRASLAPVSAQPLDLDRLQVIADLLYKRDWCAISEELKEMIAQARATPPATGAMEDLPPLPWESNEYHFDFETWMEPRDVHDVGNAFHAYAREAIAHYQRKQAKE